jgi:hypothetical protein
LDCGGASKLTKEGGGNPSLFFEPKRQTKSAKDIKDISGKNKKVAKKEAFFYEGIAPFLKPKTAKHQREYIK